jgi:hypothetical protein
MWLIPSGPDTGFSVSAGPARRIAGAAGSTITAPQNAEQAARAMPFPSPMHPLHLPGIGTLTGIDVSVSAAFTLDVTAISGRPIPCVVKPTAKTVDINKAAICRMRRNVILSGYLPAGGIASRVSDLLCDLASAARHESVRIRRRSLTSSDAFNPGAVGSKLRMDP